MDKALNYLSLARKAGLAELGEEPVGDAARAGKACVVLVASDASDHTWRRALSFVAYTGQQCVRAPYDKDQMGQAVGRTSLAIAAITDAPLALAMLRSLPEPERFQAAINAVAEKAAKVKQRQSEAKAHIRNVRKGKK